eukprot:3941217-Rhodomonas_salina.4
MSYVLMSLSPTPLRARIYFPTLTYARTLLPALWPTLLPYCPTGSLLPRQCPVPDVGMLATRSKLLWQE